MAMSISNISPPSLSQEIAEGKGLLLAQAAKLFPPSRPGSRVHPSTLFRWVRDGVLMDDGTRVYLEVVRVAGKFVTSKSAIVRFLERQSMDLNHHKAEPEIRSYAKRTRAHQQATERLQKDYGI